MSKKKTEKRPVVDKQLTAVTMAFTQTDDLRNENQALRTELQEFSKSLRETSEKFSAYRAETQAMREEERLHRERLTARLDLLREMYDKLFERTFAPKQFSADLNMKFPPIGEVAKRLV